MNWKNYIKNNNFNIILSIIIFFTVLLLIFLFRYFNKEVKEEIEKQTTKKTKNSITDIFDEIESNNIIKCRKYLENPSKYLEENGEKPKNCVDTKYLKNPFQGICKYCKMKKIKNKDERNKFINNSSMPLCVGNKCCVIEQDSITFGCPQFCFNTNLKNKNNLSDEELKYIFKESC